MATADQGPNAFLDTAAVMMGLDLIISVDTVVAHLSGALGRPDVIKGFHWLTFAGDKFSTSGGRGLSCEAALDVAPADLWRWWLIANAPETADVDFRLERFAADVNKDLADVFGNLVQRIVRFAQSAFGGVVPPGGELTELERALAADVAWRVDAARTCHLAREFRRAASETRALWSRANAYVQEAAPWSLLRANPARAALVTRIALNLIEICATTAWSVIPTIATSAFAAIGKPPCEGAPPWPNNVGSKLLEDRSNGATVPVGFEPVAKVDIERFVSGSI